MQFYGLRKCPSVDENNPAGCKQLKKREKFRKIGIGQEFYLRKLKSISKKEFLEGREDWRA